MEKGNKRLAVLVGCNYAGTEYALRGCINDVRTMRETLLDRFGFEGSDILVLTDEPGAAVLPTGADIKRVLGDMIDRARPGDVLYFHYSGHGTLIPAVDRRSSSGGREHDEAIVPCDFNLITNVDFRRLVDRLPAGATFTMVSDSCHSGGLIDKEKEQIGPSTVTDRAISRRPRGRLIPYESVLQHLTALSGIHSLLLGDHLSHLFGHETSPLFSQFGGLTAHPLRPDEGILLSGCQPNETSADMSPQDDDDDDSNDDDDSEANETSADISQEDEDGSNDDMSPAEEDEEEDDDDDSNYDSDDNDDSNDSSPAGEAGKAYGAFSNAIQIVLKEDESALSNRELVMRTRKVLKESGFEQHPCLYCSDKNADAPFLWQRTQALHLQQHPQQQQQQVMGYSGAYEGQITTVTISQASVRWNMDSS